MYSVGVEFSKGGTVRTVEGSEGSMRPREKVGGHVLPSNVKNSEDWPSHKTAYMIDLKLMRLLVKSHPGGKGQ